MNNFKNPKLTLELVPTSSHFKNLRSMLSKAQWDAVRTRCYVKAGYKCEICGGVGRRHPVECHEVWSYQRERGEQKGKQVLERTIALCPECHRVKHMGLAFAMGKAHLAIEHLAKVNEWSDEEQTELYIATEFKKHAYLSQFEWDLDISWIHKTEKKV